MTLRMTALVALCITAATTSVAQPVPGTELDTSHKIYSGSVPMGEPMFEMNYTTRFLGAEGDVVLTEICTEQARKARATCDVVTGQAVLNGVIPLANLQWRPEDGDRAALTEALRKAEPDDGVTPPEQAFLPLTEGKTVTWSFPANNGRMRHVLTQTCCSTTSSPFGADHQVWTLRIEIMNEGTGEKLGTAALQYDAEVGWVFAQQSSGLSGAKSTTISLPTDLRLPE